jgi:hypothetical protein
MVWCGRWPPLMAPVVRVSNFFPVSPFGVLNLPPIFRERAATCGTAPRLLDWPLKEKSKHRALD